MKRHLYEITINNGGGIDTAGLCFTLPLSQKDYKKILNEGMEKINEAKEWADKYVGITENMSTDEYGIKIETTTLIDGDMNVELTKYTAPIGKCFKAQRYH